MQTQTVTRSRPIGDTLALVFLLVGAGLVIPAVTAIGSIPLVAMHARALMIFGAFGGIALLLLASWVCSKGDNIVAGLLYFLFCVAEGISLAPLAAMAAQDREIAQIVYIAAFSTFTIVAILALVASWLPQQV